jgi:hypothetical protein
MYPLKLSARYGNFWSHTMSHRCDESWKGWSTLCNNIYECSLNTRTRILPHVGCIVFLCFVVENNQHERTFCDLNISPTLLQVLILKIVYHKTCRSLFLNSLWPCLERHSLIFPLIFLHIFQNVPWSWSESKVLLLLLFNYINMSFTWEEKFCLFYSFPFSKFPIVRMDITSFGIT